MKRSIALITAILLLTFSLFGCAATTEKTTTTAATTTAATTTTGGTTTAGTTTSGKQIKVGIASQSLKEAVYRDMKAAAETKAAELNVYMEWQSCDLDPQKELEIVNNYIMQDFDVIVIEPVSPEVSTEMANACAAAKIPLIDLEAIIIAEGDAKPKLRVTCDFRAIGQAKVKEFLKDFGTGPANMVILAGTMGDNVAKDLVDGYHDILKDNPQIKVVQEEWHANWDRQLAMNTMQNVLARGDKVDVVIANNDGMGVGGVRAAEEAGLEKDILFYAMDHDKDAVVEIQNGVKYKTVDKTSALQGARCIEGAVALANGQTLTFDKEVDGIPTWFTPFSWVSKDDLSISKEKFPELFK